MVNDSKLALLPIFLCILRSVFKNDSGGSAYLVHTKKKTKKQKNKKNKKTKKTKTKTLRS